MDNFSSLLKSLIFSGLGILGCLKINVLEGLLCSNLLNEAFVHHDFSVTDEEKNNLFLESLIQI